MSTPIPDEPAPPGPQDLTIPGALTIHEGSGPLYLREVLATAREGAVEFEVTRIIPMGLHIRAKGPMIDGEQVETVAVVDEQAVIRAVCEMLRDRQRPPFPGQG